MEIPENWQEELMLRDWKNMRIERCQGLGGPHAWYRFPNGVRLQYSKIKVDLERAPAVVAALSDWEPEMKVNKKRRKKRAERNEVVTIKLNWERLQALTIGELEDFKWRIYSLDI